jgi:hypothetical protein
MVVPCTWLASTTKGQALSSKWAADEEDLLSPPQAPSAASTSKEGDARRYWAYPGVAPTGEVMG